MRSHRLRALGLVCSLTFILTLTGWTLPSGVAAQQTVGLFVNDSAAGDGYTLFCGLGSTETYLIDNYGRVVNTWSSAYPPGSSVYLLENGDLIRPCRITSYGFGGRGGRIERYDWDGNLVWEYTYLDSTSHVQHHDIEVLPNGNILILAWEIHSNAEAEANGRDPDNMPLVDGVWAEQIIEVKPIGTDSADIVWQWSVWDHLIQDFDNSKANYGLVADHPELIDINYIALENTGDWLHANSIEYNEELDQIVISPRFFREIWIIDHSTTTAEAAGHTGGNSGMGGDLLYRWGNPIAHRAGDSTDQQLWWQHDAQWIKPGLEGEGNLLIFNNGSFGRGYSTVDEITPPLLGDGTYQFPATGQPFAPALPTWTYPSVPDSSFYSSFVSGMQRLPNGNTLICDGPAGRFFEVTPDEQIVWEYISPSDSTGPLEQGETPFFGSVFRCWKYAPDYPGLSGRDLTPSTTIEIYPITIAATAHAPVQPTDTDAVVITTEVSSADPISTVELMINTGGGFSAVTMFDDGAHDDGLAADGVYGASLAAQPAGTHVEYYIDAENSTAATVQDPANPPSTLYRFTVEAPSCCVAIRGDINGDGINADPVDLSCLVDHLFGGGCSLGCPEETDVNADGSIADPVDLSYLVDHLFAGGPAPVDCP